MAAHKCSTPKNAGKRYDWRDERWVKPASKAATAAGLRITAAFAADGDDEQDTEDASVLLLSTPANADLVVLGPVADQIIRYRLAHAVAQCIDDALREYGIDPGLGEPVK